MGVVTWMLLLIYAFLPIPHRSTWAVEPIFSLLFFQSVSSCWFHQRRISLKIHKKSFIIKNEYCIFTWMQFVYSTPAFNYIFFHDVYLGHGDVFSIAKITRMALFEVRWHRFIFYDLKYYYRHTSSLRCIDKMIITKEKNCSGRSPIKTYQTVGNFWNYSSVHLSNRIYR